VPEADFRHTLMPHELEELEDLGERATFPAAATIVAQGESSDRVLLVRGGRVRVIVRAPSGAEVELVARGAGELLGDVSGIDGQPRSASVVALDEVAGVAVFLRVPRFPDGRPARDPVAARADLAPVGRGGRAAGGARLGSGGRSAVQTAASPSSNGWLGGVRVEAAPVGWHDLSLT
jgi:hypothetical protein